MWVSRLTVKECGGKRSVTLGTRKKLLENDCKIDFDLKANNDKYRRPRKEGRTSHLFPKDSAYFKAQEMAQESVVT